MAMIVGWFGSVGTRMLSRYREFGADAGAATLTGNPAALASALMKVSDGVAALPATDLRAVAARDPFHLLPVARATRRRLIERAALQPPVAGGPHRPAGAARGRAAARPAH